MLCASYISRTFWVVLVGICFLTFSAEAAKGISSQDARHLALEKEPGRILEIKSEKKEDRLVYEFEVQREDGKIMLVTVDTLTGKAESKLDRISFDTPLPSEAVPHKTVKENAQKHVQQMRGDTAKALVREFKMTEKSGQIVYEVGIRAEGEIYIVFVDAINGKVLSATKDE